MVTQGLPGLLAITSLGTLSIAARVLSTLHWTLPLCYPLARQLPINNFVWVQLALDSIFKCDHCERRKKKMGQEDYAGWLMIAACWAEMWSLAVFSKVHNNMSLSDLWSCWHFFWVDAFAQIPIRLEAWTPTMNDASGVEGLSNFAELPFKFHFIS